MIVGPYEAAAKFLSNSKGDPSTLSHYSHD